MTTRKMYVAENGRDVFRFAVVPARGHFDIYCTAHPGFAGRDPSVSRTHLFASGEVCIENGSEPRTLDQALRLAKLWAEYCLRYRATGKVEG